MRVGAVDIGANTAQLLIADVSRRDLDVVVEPVHRAVTATGLGRGVERQRRLDSGAMGRTLSVLRGYASAAARHGCDTTLAVATAAVRLSSNGADFLERAETALGSRPVLLDGGEEAALAFRGARFGLHLEPPVLLIHPDAGSTELAMGKTDPEFRISLDTGSRRLSERRLSRVPVASGAIAAARGDVADLLDDVELPEMPGTVLGIGGSVTTLGALALGTPTVPHGSVLPVETITSTIGLLAAMSPDQIARLPGVQAGQADVLLGGAVIVEQALIHAAAVEIIISNGGLIDGLALEAAESLELA